MSTATLEEPVESTQTPEVGDVPEVGDGAETPESPESPESSPTLTGSFLTEQEARESLARVLVHVQCASNELQDARRELLYFHQHSGWLALGYDSFSECCAKEMTASRIHVYRLVAAAEMDDRLAKKLSPAGYKYQPLPERLLRELREMDEEDLDATLDVATEGLPAGGAPTSEDMRAALRELEKADPEFAARQARKDGREARGKAKKRKELSAEQKSEARIDRSKRMMRTLIRWLHKEGWSREQMHALLDDRYDDVMEAVKKGGDGEDGGENTDSAGDGESDGGE